MNMANVTKTADVVQFAPKARAVSQPLSWSDDEIVDGILVGDPLAADALYSSVGDVVARAVGQVVGRSDGDVEDLMQVAFERLVHSLARGRFARACSLRAWASLIASRVAIDALRGRRRERTFFDRSEPSDELKSVPHDPKQSPETSADSRRQLSMLRDAMSRMTPEKAQAVYLHDVMGHDLNEIATLTGVSVAAAQSRLVRGRKELLRRVKATFKVSNEQ